METRSCRRVTRQSVQRREVALVAVQPSRRSAKVKKVTPKRAEVNRTQESLLPLPYPVQWRKSPFCEISNVIIEPTMLEAPNTINPPSRVPTYKHAKLSFRLMDLEQSDENLLERSEFHLRICAVRNPGAVGVPQEETVDCYPPNLQVFVNEIEMTTVDQNHANPVNLTSIYARLESFNEICISWVIPPVGDQEDLNPWGYAATVHLVERFTYEDLTSELKLKPGRPAQATIDMIAELIKKRDAGITCPKTVRVSLACPIGKQRIKWPCRSTSCGHLQCFDAVTFLEMSESRPFRMLSCPVCNLPLEFESLETDMYFLTLIPKVSPERGDIVNLHPNGNFSIPVADQNGNRAGVGPSRKRKQASIGGRVQPTPVIEILDDDEIQTNGHPPPQQPKVLSTVTVKNFLRNQNQVKNSTKKPEVVQLD
ncbi:E3 SUMO-protein ligase PIAS2 [Orchesella cincta]|uniref:E3 SUMO-protein ligase PIAS2 n=1 Tax=Orchesella cincta TaxID=48709 RepID=A0A1D2MHU9_ORCCI|nr:E3 SUMO-protein ligase PIAS2 [Orchesella cincta]